MAVSYNNLVNDDGSNTVGTLVDKAELQLLLVDTVPAARTDTGTVNNWAPGLDGHTMTTWAGAADIVVTGVAGGILGQRWTFRNHSTKIATFPHNSGSSTAGNTFANFATSAATPIASGGSATWEYDGTFWRIVAHEQRDWITPVFAAGDYTGNGAMTWTLTAGDVFTQKYRLAGRTIQMMFFLQTTSVGGTPNTALQMGSALWGGFTAPSLVSNRVALTLDNNVLADSFARTNGAALLQIFKTSIANWTASANLTQLEGQIMFDVT